MKVLGGIALALGLAALPVAGHAANISFSDNFNSGPSAHWQSYTGDWYGHDGVYEALHPSNNPTTISTLDFVFDTTTTQMTYSVDVNAMGDGGLWVNTDGTWQNGILIVLGGLGYGPSGGNQGGHSIYWHIVQNGLFTGALNQADGFVSPGNNYNLTVTAFNGHYTAAVDGVVRTTLDTNLFAGGRVGLYDEWGPMTFDNFNVTGVGTDPLGVPEPASWALMMLGFGGLGAVMRRRRAAAFAV